MSRTENMFMQLTQNQLITTTKEDLHRERSIRLWSDAATQLAHQFHQSTEISSIWCSRCMNAKFLSQVFSGPSKATSPCSFAKRNPAGFGSQRPSTSLPPCTARGGGWTSVRERERGDILIGPEQRSARILLRAFFKGNEAKKNNNNNNKKKRRFYFCAFQVARLRTGHAWQAVKKQVSDDCSSVFFSIIYINFMDIFTKVSSQAIEQLLS